MPQLPIAQCFPSKPTSTPTGSTIDNSRLRPTNTNEASRHPWQQHDPQTVNDTFDNNDNTAMNDPNQEVLHNYFDAIVSERNHLSLFKTMTEKSPSFIDVTLTSSSSSVSMNNNYTQNNSINNDTTGEEGGNSRNSKLSKLKMQWDESCLKWGFIVVRQLTFVHNTYSDILQPKPEGGTSMALGTTQGREEEMNNNNNNVNGSSIIVNGHVALKEKDEIVVTYVIPNSPAYEAGMVQGDVIHAVYGMKDPTLSLLFGIMRDSARFVLTVKRMESGFERSFREKNGMMSGTKRPTPFTSSSREKEEKSSRGGVGHEGNSQLEQSNQECNPFDSVSEHSIGDDSDYIELFGETVAEDTTNTAEGLESTQKMSSIFPEPEVRNPQKGDKNLAKDNIVQKPVATYYKDMSRGEKENYSIMVDGNRSSIQTSNVGSNTSVRTSNSISDHIETNVTNSFQPRQTMGISSFANDQSGSDSLLVQTKIESRRSDRDGSVFAVASSSKDSITERTNLITKTEQSTKNISTLHNRTHVEGAQGHDTDAKLRIRSASDAMSLESNKVLSIKEANSDSDEVLLSHLIKKSIEKGTKSRNADQNTQKLKKKRKLSDVASITSKTTDTAGIQCTADRLENGTSSIEQQNSERDKRKLKKTAKIDVSLSEECLDTKRNSSKKTSDSKRNGKGSNRQSVDRSNNDHINVNEELTFYPNNKTDDTRRTDMITVGDAEFASKIIGHDVSLKHMGGSVSIPNENMESESKHEALDNSSYHLEMACYSEESSKVRNNSISSLDFSTADDENQIRTIRASPLTVPRPSPLTVSRQPSKVTVTSTSSKVGLGPVKSAKLKRLWPDSSVFSKRILKWGPPELVIADFNIRFKGNVRSNSKNNLPVIPSSFRDASEMIKYMSPHILDEGVHSIQQEFLANSDRNGLWTRDVFSMKLRHSIPVDPRPISNCNPSVRTYEFSFSLDSNNGLQPPGNLGEMFVIHSPSWKQKCCLGIIGSNDINSTFLADQTIEDDDSFDLFKLWICVCSEPLENSGWLYEADMPTKNPDGSFPSETMYMLNIGTSTDMMRQYEGLKSLACLKLNIKRAIYCSDIEKIEHGDIIEELPSEPMTKPSCICSTVWDHLKKTTNPYQLSAIEKIMSGKVKDNIALLQGPPGTGKTSTTVALVSALLNGSVPIPGAKTGGTRVQVGRALQSSNDGVVKHNSSVARRILVCAPSNQAVDELAWKIHTNALGGNGKIGCFNIVRFGMLPGEDRHDGRGKRSSQRASSFYGNERDNFLSAINLDKMVRDVAAGKEIYNFRSSDPINNMKSSDTARKSRYINFTVERQKILSRCHVVCTTLSGAGSKAFIESVSRDEFPQSEFDAVVIDEACQGSETSCLIPLKYNPNIIVLVGDPNQLPVMTLSPGASRCNADRSLFERLHANGWPINMLRIQYRMHPEIVKFPSQTFYKSNLITCDLIKNRKPSAWHNHLAFPPYLLWNVRDGAMSRGSNGGISNNAEANFVVKLLSSFSERYSDVRNIEIGIISFYNDQVGRIKQKVKDRNLMRWMNSNNISLQVSTVDGFQGSEKDIIILSCVRSRWVGKNMSKDIGFLKDFRRVNVALTRAKHSLWVVAHCEMLNRDPLWNKLIDDAGQRKLIAESSDLERFLGTSRQKLPDRRRSGGAKKKMRH